MLVTPCLGERAWTEITIIAITLILHIERASYIPHAHGSPEALVNVRGCVIEGFLIDLVLDIIFLNSLSYDPVFVTRIQPDCSAERTFSYEPDFSVPPPAM